MHFKIGKLQIILWLAVRYDCMGNGEKHIHWYSWHFKNWLKNYTGLETVYKFWWQIGPLDIRWLK